VPDEEVKKAQHLVIHISNFVKCYLFALRFALCNKHRLHGIASTSTPGLARGGGLGSITYYHYYWMINPGYLISRC
jgi:hypothetical protein